MKQIGLFGGSFDPVHQGHLLVAQAAREELQLDRLFFIPAARSPFKPESQPAPARERLRLLRLALAGQSHCEIDTQELERGGTSFTIDTVRHYTARFPGSQLNYLIGTDHVPQLPRWRDALDLAQRVRFIVIPRPGTAPATLPPPFDLVQLQGFPLGVSSSQIRTRIRAGQSIDLLAPPAVAEAIRNNQLYL